MTPFERVRYQVLTEIDVYINLVQERVFEDNPHKEGIEQFIQTTVVPRFNKLRDILRDIEEEMEMLK